MTDKFLGLYEVRDSKEEDKNFILATFLRGLYYGDSWFSLIPKDIFMANYKQVAQTLVSSPKVTIKVACLKEDPDVILGYSILSNDFKTIHWVYVKSSKLKDGTTWRRKGIGRSLVPQYPETVTHLTKLGHSLLTKFNGAVFNPFLGA
jgi:hypothetical protein